jgi:hypothetical protein
MFCSQPHPLELTYKCNSYMSVYTATDEDQLVRLALDKTSGCTVEQIVPGNVSTTTCETALYG